MQSIKITLGHHLYLTIHISMDISNIMECLQFTENLTTRTLIFQCGRIQYMWTTQHLQ